MRFLLPLFLGSLLVACSAEPRETPPPLPNAAPASAAQKKPPPAPGPTLEEQLEEIKAEYALIVRELAAEVYAMDSIAYTCDDQMISGEVLLFADTEETKVVINSFSVGDHSGSTEYWYFSDGAPFFVLEESGVWSFGGPMQADENGRELPGTIDTIEQRRYYIVDGKVVRELRKEVTLKSWEEGPSIDDIPNQTVQPPGGLPAGADLIRAAMEKGEVDCTQL